jgi:CheY-like chemotaxis protein
VRNSNLHATAFAGTSISVLFLTVDLREADHLVFQMRKIAPNLYLDISPNAQHTIRHLGHHNVVLIDQRIPEADRAQLITHIRQQGLNVPILLLFGADAADPMRQVLKAGADDSIMRSRNFASELPQALEQALVRFQSKASSRRHSPFFQYAGDRIKDDPKPDEGPLGADPELMASGRRREKNSDRRSSARYEVNLPCFIEWRGVRYDAMFHDISMTGAFLESTAPAPTGSKILIHLDRAGHHVEFEATITHHGWYLTEFQNFDGFGVQFSNPTKATEAYLNSLYEENPQPAAPKAVLEH